MATVVGCAFAGNVLPPIKIWEAARDTRILAVVTATNGLSCWEKPCGESGPGGAGDEPCPFEPPDPGVVPLPESPAGADEDGRGDGKGFLNIEAIIPPRSTDAGGGAVDFVCTLRSWVGVAASEPVWMGSAETAVLGSKDGGGVSPMRTVCVRFHVVTTSGLAEAKGNPEVAGVGAGDSGTSVAVTGSTVSAAIVVSVVCMKVIQRPVPEQV